MNESAPPQEIPWYASEDWLAVWIGGLILVISLLASRAFLPSMLQWNALPEGVPHCGTGMPVHPLSDLIAKPAKWEDSLSDSTKRNGRYHNGMSYLIVALVAAALFSTGLKLRGERARPFLLGFAAVFALALFALTVAAQKNVKQWNLEYALWALGIGLLISNVIGTPNWVRPALRTEYYIKTGLVLLGAKILFTQLMQLGPRGLVVAWVVTPIVLITTYWFGQRILKIPSKSLNMVISADMSVCGVSAAIATSAACRAKKEELSLAIGISLIFTVIMMIIMPAVIAATGMSQHVGGAWMGGTIDSTGAVAAAGSLVGPDAENAAVTIKMIQNILIGVTAFGVALYWVRYVEPTAEGDSEPRKADASEIWRRFPKFVIGFLTASIVFSLLQRFAPHGKQLVDLTLKNGSEIFRSWFFAIAFVSIGLETNFRELGKYLKGGKPLLLYVCGQTLNLTLTLIMAWLMFRGVK